MADTQQSTTHPPPAIDDRRLNDVAHSLRRLSVDCARLAEEIAAAEQLQGNLEQLALARQILRDARAQATFDDAGSRRAVVADIAPGMEVYVVGETPLGRWWTVETIKPHWSNYPNIVAVMFVTNPGCAMELTLNVNDPVRVKR